MVHTVIQFQIKKKLKYSLIKEQNVIFHTGNSNNILLFSIAKIYMYMR